MIARLATPEDKSGIIDIATEWLDESRPGHNPDKISASVDDILTDKHTIIVKDGDSIIGFISFRFYDNIWRDCRSAIEDLFFVRKAYRGMGIARTLIESFELMAKNDGCKFIVFLPNTDGGNIDASKAVFQKSGYRLYGYMMRKDI